MGGWLDVYAKRDRGVRGRNRSRRRMRDKGNEQCVREAGINWQDSSTPIIFPPPRRFSAYRSGGGNGGEGGRGLEGTGADGE
jgi:hypothetical protein